MTEFHIQNSSFRDPSGFLFFENNILYRQINQKYKIEYDHLMDSGLYKELVESELLISHDEVDICPPLEEKCYKIIKPKIIPFISYPYEWCFSQLKDAALLTLQIQKIAMKYNMTLKDASSYNVQFRHGKPIFIDTLSFEKYHEGQTWKPYKQFCQHFLAPLALMSQRDIRLNQLLQVYIDGIPLDLTDKLLPSKKLYTFSLLSHIHFHAKSQKHYEDKDIKIKTRKMPHNSFVGLIESLYSGIKKLNWSMEKTEWGNYYDATNYSESSFDEKIKIVSEFLNDIESNMVWDLGANTGIFSRIASEKNIETISFDIDPAAVEKNYLTSKKNSETKILPLLLDLINPSSGIGWNSKERDSLMNRGPTDTVFALALIHHLAISNNVPLFKIAEFFQNISKYLIIEFIPKSDSQVKRLLLTREDIFDDYDQQHFEDEFKKFFTIKKSKKVQDSERVLYLLEKSE
jgi:hypothetical protein